MKTVAVQEAHEPSSHRLARSAALLASATAVAGLVALPIAMVVANKSAPLFLLVTALLANAAALSVTSFEDLLKRYGVVLGSPLALLCFALIILAVFSFGWTIDRDATWRGLREAVPEFIAAAGLAAAWPVAVKRSHLGFLKFGLLGALAFILIEALAGMPVHHWVGARAEDYDLKRSVVPVVLLLWPCLEHGFGQHRTLWIGGLMSGTLAAGVLAHSSASVAALVLSILIYGAARIIPRPTLWLGAAAAVLLLATAPWTGSIIKHILQPEGVAFLARQHADIRVGLWSNFGQHVPERMWLGHGFDASLMVSGSPQLDHSRDFPMTWNVHPHSILLQVWVEFGLVGAALALLAMVFAVWRLARLTVQQRAYRLAFAGSAATVALVGLNAWSPWWLAVAFLGMILFKLQREVPARSSGDA